jgi:hypothetical protein
MIISVARWNLPLSEAQKIAQEIAPVLRDNGATQIQCGVIQIGQHAGRVVTAVTYPNLEAYGKAIGQQENNNTYRQAMARIQDRLLDRQVINTEEVK